MYSISSVEIYKDWGCVWDCLVEACHGSDELEAILDKYEKLPAQNHIAVVNCLINHFFSDASIRLVAMWGFSDTPARDEIYLDLKRKKDQLKPYLENYLG